MDRRERKKMHGHNLTWGETSFCAGPCYVRGETTGWIRLAGIRRSRLGISEDMLLYSKLNILCEEATYGVMV